MAALFLDVLFPLYLVIALGFLLGRICRDLDTRHVSTIVLNVLAPALVFHSFRSSSLSVDDFFRVFIVAFGVVVLCYTVCFLFERLFLGFRDKAFEISSAFMNSGYLGLPLVFLMFGEKGFFIAIAFSISMTFLHFTLGILLLQGGSVGKGVLAVLKQPLVWAMLSGWFLKGVSLTSGMEKMLRLTGEATLPVMLVSIGIALSRITPSDLFLSVVSTVVRFAGGAAGAYLFCRLLGCGDLMMSVLVVQASLPSAVMNYVLCEAYGENSHLAASVIFVSTALFPLFLPLLKMIYHL